MQLRPQFIGFALAVALAACTGGLSPGGKSEATNVASPLSGETTPRTTGRFPQGEATLSSLFRAYNAGRLDEVLALVDDEVVWGDCDYREVKAVGLTGKARLAEWLRRAFADHDHLEVFLIEIAPGAPPVGAVTYSRRTSDTLRALGFPNGITPRFGTKVVLTPTADRVITFANGPTGGPHELCRPTR